MSPSVLLRASSWTLALLFVLAGLPAAPAVAQDGGATPVPLPEDEDHVEQMIASLRAPVLRRYPERLMARVQEVFELRSPRAEQALRGYLRDTGADSVLVEQIIVSTLLSPDRLRLLDDVVARLRIEQDTALDRDLAEPLLLHASRPLVLQLGEFVGDAGREAGFRATAIRTLGRTRHAGALPVLLVAWRNPDPSLSAAAERAFTEIVPGVTTHEEAAGIVREMEERQLPLAEILRRRLRRMPAPTRSPDPPPESSPEYRDEYLALAHELLPRCTLDQLVRLFIESSPLADLRATAARRLVEYPFDDEQDPRAARRAAGRACLAALSDEKSEDVVLALLEALIPLAAELRDHVGGGALDALPPLVRESGGASWEIRQSAVKFLRELGDPGSVTLLQETYDELGDTNWEFRLEVLEALAQVDVDQTGWLAERALGGTDVRVVRQIVILLGRKSDPAAIVVYTSLLSRPHPDDKVRLYAVGSLAKLWAHRESVLARGALIEYGLHDTDGFVRQTAAAGLGNPGRGDREVNIPALQRALESDQNAKVRLEAAKSLIALDEDNAVSLLLPAFKEEDVWKEFLKHRREGCLRRGTAPERLLADADFLWVAGEPDLQARAVELLSAVADAQTALWEGRESRGLIRERLAELLLAQGRPKDARVVVATLLAAEPRETDPGRRWELLMARTLRATRTTEALRDAWGLLAKLHETEDLPAALGPRVLLELGDTLLALDDPSGALSALRRAESGVDDLGGSDRARHLQLTAEAEEKSRNQRREVLRRVEALSRAGTPEAKEAVLALGHRAARHLNAELRTEKDPSRVRQLLAAAAELAGRTFVVPEDALPEQVAEQSKAAREALDALVERARPPAPKFR